MEGKIETNWVCLGIVAVWFGVLVCLGGQSQGRNLDIIIVQVDAVGDGLDSQVVTTFVQDEINRISASDGFRTNGACIVSGINVETPYLVGVTSKGIAFGQGEDGTRKNSPGIQVEGIPILIHG